MEVVQPAVEAEAVDVACSGAVIAQLAHFGVDVGVVRDQGAAVAEGAEVLLDDEAGGGGVAQVPDLELRSVRADGLGVVLDNLEVMLVGNLLDGGHVGALAVKVDGNDGLRLRRDGGLDLLRADALGVGAAIHENRGGACDPDGLGGGKEGVRVGDDLIARADAKGHEGEPDGVGAVADADGVFGAVISCQLSFELLEHGAHDVLAALQHRWMFLSICLFILWY